MKKKLDFQICTCISYSIQRKSSQITPRIHFCLDLLRVLDYHTHERKRRSNFLRWLKVEILKKWCAVSNNSTPGVIWDRTKLAISQLLVVVERWNFLGVIWAWNARFWLVTIKLVANKKKLFRKNLKFVSSHPELRFTSFNFGKTNLCNWVLCALFSHSQLIFVCVAGNMADWCGRATGFFSNFPTHFYCFWEGDARGYVLMLSPFLPWCERILLLEFNLIKMDVGKRKFFNAIRSHWHVI